MSPPLFVQGFGRHRHLLQTISDASSGDQIASDAFSEGQTAAETPSVIPVTPGDLPRPAKCSTLLTHIKCHPEVRQM